ncbi:phosphomevalonate kinase-like isoform X2 [Ornithodoros turicata]|uniref:phosphomevalonate kinase-like isoform X2 n=1 Tax=Ornithodoros turicata TaxID=34597 RepID=UPI003138C3D1
MWYNSVHVMLNPQVVLVLSGKRKSGKDYITEILRKRIGIDTCAVIRLSAPLKAAYAKEHDLEFERLLDASAYKENFRAAMVAWGEERRQRDPGYFCKLAIEQSSAFERPVWIISDARRTTDLQYFKQNYPSATRTIRVKALDEVRAKRGWIFTPGIDDKETECGLDDVQEWDTVISNDDDGTLDSQLSVVLENVEVKCL